MSSYISVLDDTLLRSCWILLLVIPLLFCPKKNACKSVLLCFLPLTLLHSNNPQYCTVVKLALYSVHIRHKSARMGEILNPCHNHFSSSFFSSSSWWAENGLCVEISLLSQVTTVGGSPKILFIPVDHTWMTR